MNVVLFYVWEDARVWAYWNHSFYMHFNYLGPVSCIFHAESSQAAVLMAWWQHLSFADVAGDISHPQKISSLTSEAPGPRSFKGELAFKKRNKIKLNSDTYGSVPPGFGLQTAFPQTGALYQPRRVGWGGRWEGGSRGRGYMVYLWLIHVEVWQKTTKFCKAIILQLINNFLKKLQFLYGLLGQWGVRVFPGGANGKEPACQCRRCKRCGFSPQVGKIPWGRKWKPTPVFLPGETHGQRRLQATVHGVSKSWTWLKQLNTHICFVCWVIRGLIKFSYFTKKERRREEGRAVFIHSPSLRLDIQQPCMWKGWGSWHGGLPHIFLPVARSAMFMNPSLWIMYVLANN